MSTCGRIRRSCSRPSWTSSGGAYTEAVTFIVQEAIHADSVSSHETREEAVEAIEDLIQAGLASPGDFNIRELDATGRIVRVINVDDPPLPIG